MKIFLTEVLKDDKLLVGPYIRANDINEASDKIKFNFLSKKLKISKNCNANSIIIAIAMPPVNAVGFK